jgi:hypothetical protein
VKNQLSVCPVCEYSLAGLPAAHRCPECGYAYDESTRVWYSEGRYGSICMPVLIVSAAAIVSLYFGSLRGRPGSMSYLSEGILAFWAAWMIRAVVISRTRQFAAMGPDNIAIRLGLRQIRIIPWGEIRGIRLSPAANRDFLFLVLMNQPPIDLSGVLTPSSAITDFVQSFNERQTSVADGLSNAHVHAA